MCVENILISGETQFFLGSMYSIPLYADVSMALAEVMTTVVF